MDAELIRSIALSLDINASSSVRIISSHQVLGRQCLINFPYQLDTATVKSGSLHLI